MSESHKAQVQAQFGASAHDYVTSPGHAGGADLERRVAKEGVRARGQRGAAVADHQLRRRRVGGAEGGAARRQNRPAPAKSPPRFGSPATTVWSPAASATSRARKRYVSAAAPRLW